MELRVENLDTGQIDPQKEILITSTSDNQPSEQNFAYFSGSKKIQSLSVTSLTIFFSRTHYLHASLVH